MPDKVKCKSCGVEIEVGEEKNAQCPECGLMNRVNREWRGGGEDGYIHGSGMRGPDGQLEE